MLSSYCSHIQVSQPPRVSKFSAMPPKLNAAQRAARADALMLELRQIGYLPRATNSSTGRRLALALRRARAAGDMDAYESELESLAARERGGAAKHAEEAVAAAAVCPSEAAPAAKHTPSAAIQKRMQLWFLQSSTSVKSQRLFVHHSLRLLQSIASQR